MGEESVIRSARVTDRDQARAGRRGEVRPVAVEMTSKGVIGAPPAPLFHPCTTGVNVDLVGTISYIL